MGELKLNLQPLEPRVAQGAATGARETIPAGFAASRIVGSRADAERSQLNPSQYDPRAQYQDSSTRTERMTIAQEYADMPDDLRSDISAQGFDPNSETLGRVREWQRERDQTALEKNQDILSRSSGPMATLGGFAGGFGAELMDPLNIATIPIGASARAGFLATAGIEALVNAGIEGVQTSGRNAALVELGQEETGLAENMLMGAAFGAVLGPLLKGLQMGTPKALRLAGTLFRKPEDQRKLAGLMENDERDLVRTVAQQLRDDADDIDTTTGGGQQTIEALDEHERRMDAAVTAAARGEDPDIPDRPIDAVPARSIINGQIEEVDPRDLVVDPATFQFKSEGTGAEGLTDKLLSVTQWNPDLAGTIMVWENADGVRFVADGHQRTGLANRIMRNDPTQNILMAATVKREADGFSAIDVRTAAAVKNIAEAADGMTTAMARDAAKVLRIDPSAIRDLPSGYGIRRAQELTSLSDDAFALVINEIIPDNVAAVVGRLVDNPAMHMPIMRLLERTKPSTEAQAEAIVRQALAAPVQREVTEDLFGTTEALESLYLERAKVLERTMKILRDDDRTFKTLTERGDTIEGRAGNKLDNAGNAEQRKQIERATAAIQKLAYRAGPISEALDNGAKTLKDTGKLADAARAVAAAIQREIERNGFDGLGNGPTGRAAQPAAKSTTAPDPNEGFSDPVNSADADRQIANTRLDANERPAEGFNTDEEARRDLGRLVSAGASREELDSHPAVIKALDELKARAKRATNLSEVYNTPQWHASRQYVFGDEVVTGTDEALMKWVAEAEAFAGDQVRRERRATIILGPPAAGKSTIANDLARVKGAAILDSDEIKRTLPEYEGGIGAAAVHEESGDLADRLEAALRGTGANVVFPKVGGSPKSIQAAIDRFKAAGYSVELVNMAVTKENAYKRMIGRFVKEGRLIPPEYVDKIGESPSTTYRTIRDEGKLDGYAEIDNNGGVNDAKPITDRGGENPLAGSRYDLPESRGQAIQSGREGGKADPQADGRQVEQTASDIPTKGVTVTIRERRGIIILDRIVADERGLGNGSRYMNDLSTYADKVGKTIALTPSNSFGGSVPRLKRFYKQFGFVENKGKNKDFEISEGMIREPKAKPATAAPKDAPQVEQTPAGSQMLIDGVRPITAKERIQTAADRPLIAQTRTTDSEIGGMFDANDPARVDLFDQVPVGSRMVDGEMKAETVSRQELMDELDADDDFADQLGFCLK